MWCEANITYPKNRQITTTTINNLSLLITQIDDELFATTDVCPHEEIKLSLGCIQDNTIKCSLHGFSFDLRTGKCNDTMVDNLITYPIKIENNKIWININ